MAPDKRDILKQPLSEPVPLREIKKSTEIPRETPSRQAEERQVPRSKEDVPRAPGPIPVAIPAPKTPKDPVLAQIETILEEDLKDIYNELPPELRPKFKQKGEEAARAISEMVARAKIKVRKVLKLIVGWLKIIPGVNKFFLEQEAAIKAQKILAMAKEKNKKH